MRISNDSVVYYDELLQPTVIKRENKASFSIYLVSNDLPLSEKVNCDFHATDPAAKAALLLEIDSLPDVTCPDPDGELEFTCGDCGLTDQCKRYLRARLKLME